MLRKDVKIGLAIGGVFLAVLIIYLLATDAPQNNEVTLAEDPAAQSSDAAKGNAPAGQPPAEPTATKPPTNSVDGKPDGLVAAAAPNNTPAATPAENGGKTEKFSDQWSVALKEGKLKTDELPLLLTQTPSPNSTQQRPDTGKPGNDEDKQSTPPAVAEAPATQPVETPKSTQRTHVVQRGETFASIALMAYGNAAYYPHILRANPTIDPKKLRLGTTIVLPPVEDVVATDGDAQPDLLAASATQRPALDHAREYRVQPADSLYKISLKLYGRADKVDAIYQLNRELIGPNPSQVRAGMVLKLPEPPAVANAR